MNRQCKFVVRVAPFLRAQNYPVTLLLVFFFFFFKLSYYYYYYCFFFFKSSKLNYLNSLFFFFLFFSNKETLPFPLLFFFFFLRVFFFVLFCFFSFLKVQFIFTIFKGRGNKKVVGTKKRHKQRKGGHTNQGIHTHFFLPFTVLNEKPINS